MAGSRRLLWQFLPRPRPTPRWYVPTTSSGRKGNPFCTLRAEVRMLAQSLRHHTPPETGGHFHCSSRDLGLLQPASLLAQPCVMRHFGTCWFLPWSTGMMAKPLACATLPRLALHAHNSTSSGLCRQGEAFSGFYRPRSRPSPRWHVPTANVQRGRLVADSGRLSQQPRPRPRPTPGWYVPTANPRRRGNLLACCRRTQGCWHVPGVRDIVTT